MSKRFYPFFTWAGQRLPLSVTGSYWLLFSFVEHRMASLSPVLESTKLSIGDDLLAGRGSDEIVLTLAAPFICLCKHWASAGDTTYASHHLRILYHLMESH